METVQSLKSEFDLDLKPFDLKSKRSSPWVMIINWCVKYHYCRSKGDGVIVRKRCKLQSTNLTLTFDLFTLKSIGVFFPSWAIHVWSFIIEGQKEIKLSCGNHFFPQKDKQTDGQTAMVNKITPHNFVGAGGGGVMKIQYLHLQTASRHL